MTDHLAPIRALFTALSPEDRRKIFQEFSLCACKDLGDLARKHPATAVGALVGGLIGALAGESGVKAALPSVMVPSGLASPVTWCKGCYAYRRDGHTCQLDGK